MKGLQLSRQFYEMCRPLLMETIPDLMPRAAIGLAGEGSECFGLDDGISRDHDFGAGFCLWLPDDLLRERRQEIEKALASLPEEFLGFPVRLRGSRVGPIGIRSFYSFFTGLDHPPAEWQEWIFIPETQLAAAVNGAVFEDRAGEFSRWRQVLLDYYPEDVRLKKIAGRAMQMAQAGQYNLPRSLARNDAVAAMLALARFAEAAISLVFLLNRRYMPYYKLAPRLLGDLPILGSRLFATLQSLATVSPAAAPGEIEAFCADCAAIFRDQGLSSLRETWLWAHGPVIAARIQNPAIKKRNLLED